MVNNSQAEKPEIKYDNLLDYFQYYQLPLAIKMGMTPKQFWEDDPQDFWAYLDAYEQRKKDEAREENIKAFNQGQYILLAVQQCLQFSKTPKRIYPKKPFPLAFDNEKQKSQMSKEQFSDMRKAQFMKIRKQLTGK